MTPITMSTARSSSVARSHTDFLLILLTGAVVTAVLALSLPYGFQYRLTAETLPIVMTSAALVLLAALGTAGWAISRLSTQSVPKHDDPLQRPALIYLLPLGFVVISAYFSSAVFPGGPVASTAIGVLLLLVVGVLPPLRKQAMPLTLLAMLLVQSWIGIATPNDPKAANMLPVVQMACDVVAQGGNPYLVTYDKAGASGSTHYLPALIAPYCPFEWLAVDVRWLNVAVLAGLVLVLYVLARGARRNYIAAALVAMVLSSPFFAQMMAHGHILIYFMMALLLPLAVIGQRYLLAAVIAGGMVATYQLAVFLVIPIAVWTLANRTLTKRFLAAGLAGAVAVVLLSPAYFAVPEFVARFFTGLPGATAQFMQNTRVPFEQVALSDLLLRVLPPKTLTLLQLATLAVVCVAILRQRISPTGLFVLTGFTYCMIIALNPMASRYFYIPGLLFIFAALAVKSDPYAETPT